jgi:hypothetical protein
MTQDEAVAVLQSYSVYTNDGNYTIYSFYSAGRTKDGRSLDSFEGAGGGWRFFSHIPPPEAIEHCVLTFYHDDGRKLEITLGPGGIVAEKRLTPAVWADPVYIAKPVLLRLLSWRCWVCQVRNIEPSLRHKWHYIGMALAGGFLVMFVWKLPGRKFKNSQRLEKGAAFGGSSGIEPSSTSSQVHSIEPAASRGLSD